MTVHQDIPTIKVRNPRTGAFDYAFHPTSAEQLAETVRAARAAQPAWQALGVEGRIAVISDWKDELERATPALIDAVTLDTGRLRESVLEAATVSRWIDRWAAAARVAYATQPQATSSPDILSIADFSPYPLVGIISPWNFPLSLSLTEAIPALISGCAVVVKPSEITPRFVVPLTETIARVPVLAQVLKYVLGAGDLGEALIDCADMISFTGSTATGRKVAARAGGRFIPCFTELGGKDPAIVLEGADIDRATSAIATGANLATGQQCYSIERIYVHRSLHDEFVAQLVKKVQKIRLAFPTVQDGVIGPLTFAPQADIIKRHLDDARTKGARVLTGGTIENLGGGLWIRPTVLTDVDHSMQIMREESFGPLMPVMAFDTLDQAVELANDTPYGLSGAVFGPEDQAIAVARRIDAGGISVNDAGIAPFFIADASAAEKTSFKCSGLGGSRLGPDSIKRFVRKRAVLVSRAKGASPWWFDV